MTEQGEHETHPSDPFPDWCERLCRSEPLAFDEVFRFTYEPLVRYAKGLVGSTETAHDLVQETFLKLWEVRTTLDPKRSLKALLYRMVRNLAYNRRRDQSNRDAKHDLIQADTPLPVRLPDRAMDAHLLKRKLREWIDALPDRQKEALLLSRYEGLSHDEIARVMDVSPRTVNNHVVKALKYIRNQLHALEPSYLER